MVIFIKKGLRPLLSSCPILSTILFSPLEEKEMVISLPKSRASAGSAFSLEFLTRWG